MQGFAFRSTSWLCFFWPWLTAMKCINNAEGDPPVSEGHVLQQILCSSMQRSKNPTGQIATSRKTCTQQEWGFYALGFTFFFFFNSFYSMCVGSSGRFIASLVSLTIHPSFLFTWWKQVIQNQSHNMMQITYAIFSFVFCTHKRRAWSVCHDPAAWQAFPNEIRPYIQLSVRFYLVSQYFYFFPVWVTVPPATHFLSDTCSFVLLSQKKH